ncbi:amino acid adenylation domain-containing protein [Rothia sp. SD9660Na]|uniref:amino acid adenylation domain-containing protein n=1 Tax=Rothia sp. SD9660Na TaxID=3047030 RepID=UPI0024B9B851|nr:amino acid adenylation domain-containing protein [Rothia sp. SD9660Na]WHS50955.1 amino acid adenylation domain-containing protein [Rothia sp. SD9660Na]
MPLPLTSSACGIFFAQQLDPANSCYNTAEVLEAGADVDPLLMRKALEQVYAENEGLRVRSYADGAQPVWEVLDPEDFRNLNPAFPEAVLTGQGNQEPAGQGLPTIVRAWAEELTALPLDLSTGQTVRSAYVRWGGRLWFYHGVHHLVADGFAAFNALGRVAALYRQLAAGQEVSAQPRATLAELVEADAQNTELAQGQEASWQEQTLPPQVLATLTAEEADSTSPLVLSQPDTSLAGRTAQPSPRAHRRSLPISPDLQTRLLAAAQAHGVHWPHLFTAATGSYLARMSGKPYAQCGLPQMNRLLPGSQRPYGAVAARTACTAVNVLPVAVPGTGPIADALSAVSSQFTRNQNLALTRHETLERHAEQTGGRLFGAHINVVPFDAVLPLGESTATIYNISAGPVADMTFCARGIPGRGNPISLEVDGNPALYTGQEVADHCLRLLTWLEKWAQEAACGQDATLDALGAATDAELAALERLNRTEHPVEYATLLSRFREQVEKTPDALALLAPAESNGAIDREQEAAPDFSVHLTYRQLDERARQLAGTLLTEGLEPGARVGLRAERGSAQFELLYALLYAGAVYVPLSSELPDTRIGSMVQDANISLILNGPGIESLAEETGARQLAWEELSTRPASLQEAGAYPGASTALDDTAYVLFTSGSTGRPKGVAVSHRALDNRLRWQQSQIPVGEGDRVLHKTAISFDVHVWELYWPLQEGAAVVVAAPGGHRDPAYLARVLVEQAITCLHFVPTMLSAFLTSPAAGRQLSGQNLALRYLVCSGEALHSEQVSGCHRLTGVYPLNLYGPTEAAIDVTYWDTAHQPDRSPVPIGYPVWNTTLHILDRAGHPLPAGTPGELYLGGVQLAQGYENNPEANTRAFHTIRCQRLYCTGDIASLNPDGTLAYRGRTDHQVKIRGQRLELGDIDTVLAALPGVSSAVTLALPAPGGELRLAGFLETAQPEEDAVKLAREACASSLPDYMVPTLWAVYPAFPLGTSGKADRKVLASHPFTAEPGEPDAPTSLRVQELCQVFAEALNLAEYGADLNFFDAGGNSLAALRLVALLDTRLGLECSLAKVFTAPAPSLLAHQLTDDTQSETAPLLTLREHRAPDAPAYLFLPPAGGLGWCYAPYLAHLPETSGVYTLQAEQFDSPDTPWPGTLNELARTYADHCEHLPTRTLVLLGWSVGGTAAPLLTAELTSRGFTVLQTVLLDAYPPVQWQGLPEPSEAETYRALVRMAGIEPETDPGLPGALTLLRGSGSALAALDERHLATLIASMRASATMMRNAEISPVSSPLLSVSVPHPEQPTLDVAAWEPLASAGFTSVEIAGAHPDLVRAERLGEFIRNIVNK